MDKRALERELRASKKLLSYQSELAMYDAFSKAFLFDEIKNEEPRLTDILLPYHGYFHIPFKTSKWQEWVCKSHILCINTEYEMNSFFLSIRSSGEKNFAEEMEMTHREVWSQRWLHCKSNLLK